MPKDTFFNLPEDKRTLICQVALDEFAEYSFNQASINRMVAKSGIAKGSFYQYFEDKKDLFLYLVQSAAEEKLNYISPLMYNPDQHDIFTLLREMYLSGIRFADERPKYAEISRKILENMDASIYKEAMADNLPSAYEFFETLLEKSIARGEVRPDIDIKMFAYLIASMNTLVIAYYTEYIAQDYDDKMFETIDKFLDFLKNGIGKNNPMSQM
ncbi:MAG: TetR/AcrR family transcriptional regulator [Chloroflexota bacterium]